MSAESASMDSEVGNPRQRMERWSGTAPTLYPPRSVPWENPYQRYAQGSIHFFDKKWIPPWAIQGTALQASSIIWETNER
jgi:hypothetical protein